MARARGVWRHRLAVRAAAGAQPRDAFEIGAEIAAAVTAANPPPVTLKLEKARALCQSYLICAGVCHVWLHQCCAKQLPCIVNAVRFSYESAHAVLGSAPLMVFIADIAELDGL